MVRVAVTQAEPAWLDLDGTVDKTIRLIEEAAQNGAELIAFPEVWIPGYPAWIWARSVDPALATKYIKNSPSYDGPEIQKITAAAKKNKIAVVLGLSENENNSVYIAQCTISSAGDILMKRRKLKPTHMERTIYGDANAESLLNVVDVKFQNTVSAKVGALSCWEHLQPLLKYHTMSLREQIHVAAWPPIYSHDGGPAPFGMSADGCQIQSQCYAQESGSFVLHCTSVLTSAGIEAMNTKATPLFNQVGGGCSAVFGPDGRRITKPIPHDQEGIVYADLDLDLIVGVKHLIDVVGHYSRPDLLWLGVDGREKAHVRREKDDDGVSESVHKIKI